MAHLTKEGQEVNHNHAKGGHVATAKPSKTTSAKSDETRTRARLVEKALSTLRENHADEFETIFTGLCDEAGIPARRRLTGDAAKRAKAEALAASLGLTLVPIPVEVTQPEAETAAV